MSESTCSVLIIGGGVFGLSTALSLAQGKYKSNAERILVIDRSATPPEEDAASSDLNKIVRGDYSAPAYADLAHRALDKWAHDPDFKPYFHQSGIVVTASALGKHGEHYVKQSFDQQYRLHTTGRSPLAAKKLDSRDSYELAMRASPDNRTGPLPPLAYWNGVSGWAWSSGAMKSLAQRCRNAGVSFVTGQVDSLIYGEGDVRGAKTKDGRILKAETLVVLAAGSWTPAILPDISSKLTATGQVIATVMLTEEEAKKYGSIPVYIDMQTGFYMFPPNSENLIKLAFHGRGYTNEQPSLGDKSKIVSLPRTGHFEGQLNENIPIASVVALRAELARVWPELAQKPFEGTRMCWYCDTLDGDFLISYHDTYPSLFLATGGSGHAFKFLPVLGDLCMQAIEGRLADPWADVWSYTRQRSDYQPDRGDSVRVVLNPRDFAKQENLLP